VVIARGQRAIRRRVLSIEGFVNRRIAVMNKWSSVAVSAALVVAGVGASVSAEAHPYLTVGVDVPAVAVVAPYGHAPVYCGLYCYEHGRYWRRDYDRYRFDRFPRERWYRR
jgi:hypothetical protein